MAGPDASAPVPGGAAIRFERVSKAFGATSVLRAVDLEIPAGSFYCLLGPSGCGKTTMLRLLAGLETPDAGDIRLDGRSVLGLPPHRRDCALVFQNYALWPHLDVGENIVYGLRARKRPAREIADALAGLLRTYRLEGLERRLPTQLSGGQQQRVALARAMAVGPRAILMDEPLSNLDAGLRKSLRRELREFHRRSGATVLYVTHDQEEALALADSLALMADGQVVEAGRPEDLYLRPARLETARFLGDMNVWEGEAGADGMFVAPGLRLAGAPPGARHACIRPEHARLGAEAGGASLAASVDSYEFLGTHIALHLTADPGPLQIRLPPASPVPRAGGRVRVALPAEYLRFY